jgi:addiction module HigA family antidote
MAKKLPPISPGEILLEEFIKPLELSQNQLARAIDVPTGRVNDVVRGRRGISRDTAARFALFFRTTPEFWLNLQAQYDAKIASRELLPRLSKTIRPCPAAA